MPLYQSDKDRGAELLADKQRQKSGIANDISPAKGAGNGSTPAPGGNSNRNPQKPIYGPSKPHVDPRFKRQKLRLPSNRSRLAFGTRSPVR